MATGRLLQFAREVDVMTVRAFIGGNSKCNASLSPIFKTLKDGGAVTGEDSGSRDEKGYPYKRWRLAEPQKAKITLEKKHIRPMRASAMERWTVKP